MRVSSVTGTGSYRQNNNPPARNNVAFGVKLTPEQIKKMARLEVYRYSSKGTLADAFVASISERMENFANHVVDTAVKNLPPVVRIGFFTEENLFTKTVDHLDSNPWGILLKGIRQLDDDAFAKVVTYRSQAPKDEVYSSLVHMFADKKEWGLVNSTVEDAMKRNMGEKTEEIATSFRTVAGLPGVPLRPDIERIFDYLLTKAPKLVGNAEIRRITDMRDEPTLLAILRKVAAHPDISPDDTINFLKINNHTPNAEAILEYLRPH